MTHDPTSSDDDPPLQNLLHAVDHDAPAPDPAVLESLRRLSADAFDTAAMLPLTASGSTSAVEPAQDRAAESFTPTTRGPQTLLPRRTPMITILMRAAMAAVASIAVLAAWLMPTDPGHVHAAVPLEKVISELRSAQSLDLLLQRQGHESRILVRAPGLVRKESSATQYEIASGSQWWRVDETENTVASGPSPWFVSAEQQIDLLALLDVGIVDARTFLATRPSQQVLFQGQRCNVYRVDVASAQGQITLEALVNSATQDLVSLLARKAGQPAGAAPLAELRLVARNVAAPDAAFQVAATLTEDGRIGKVGAAQGIVTLRPRLAQRWTPVSSDVLLRTGDWLRTETRGANAVRSVMTSGAELTLGPGSLVECLAPGEARVHRGQVQVVLPAADGKEPVSFTLHGPRAGHETIKSGSKVRYRISRDEQLVEMGETPVWLAGFEGTSAAESLGSLIVNLPDGRNEPLTVGTHKVSVEIRDQIARTTIEETFVNHTRSRLEGVFHFPLPQDASISGFGMWIGNDLIEADVVEKQRAREIFETILREKRDPGLLEWMGGNLFKARVFPIEPNSEKRIKIVYTQVLPLRGNRYRYSYGLRSELLRKHPLRELSVAVQISSALPLKSVTCPTHSVRTQQAANSARIEFDAQEYVPTRDLEVVCEVADRQSDVVVIPHQRGDDGYLLVQLMPPGPAGNWQRELLPDGQPMALVLVCDTSSSMDVEKRRQQEEFVGAVLASLGKEDRFQLACADVGTTWLTATPTEATAESIAAAREALAQRRSLGWTNLDRAFADVVAKAPDTAQVIYIGDGIVTAGSTDGAAFVKRFQQLLARTPAARRTFHAITVGSSHESVVLNGIARSGGGSARAITGEQTPHAVALELLNEIAQPGLRDLKVEFRGVKVAAVYPEVLPNVAAGTQQILVGRYLPEGRDQAGEVIVTGRRGQEPVRYTARIALKDAEQGNSFIPRLWARAHLDSLLAQGAGQRIREDIIALSEQFHIITPYTSLLVLESDADRERFGVKRRYEMRDGERFFAEGRSRATFELAQDQMRRAGTWRVNWRRQILRELKSLGRDLRDFNVPYDDHFHLMQRSSGLMMFFDSGVDFDMSQMHLLGGMGGGMGSGMGGGMGGMGGGFGGGMGGFGGDDFGMDFQVQSELLANPIEKEVGAEMDSVDDPLPAEFEELDLKLNLGRTAYDGVQAFDFDGVQSLGLIGKKMKSMRRGIGYPMYGGLMPPSYIQWVQRLFPALPDRPATSPQTQHWTAEALALSTSLNQADRLKQAQTGLKLERTTDVFDPRWNRRSAHQIEQTLVGPAGWMERSLTPAAQTVVNYRLGNERGCYALAFLLGRRRAATPEELLPPSLGLEASITTSPHDVPWIRHARTEAAEPGQQRLILTHPQSGQTETLLIDTARHVVLKRETHTGRILESSEVFEDFVEIGGIWWARKSTTRDGDGAPIKVATLSIEAIAAADYAPTLNSALVDRNRTQFVELPFVSLAKAQQHVADGTATFNDRLSLILDLSQRQKWDEVRAQLTALEAAGAATPGVRWLRPLIQAEIRENDSARKWFLEEARALAAAPRPDELFLCQFLISSATAVTAPAELLELIDVLEPVADRWPQETDARAELTMHRISALEQANDRLAALALRRKLLDAFPWHVHWHIDYAARLAEAGELTAARTWLRQEIDRKIRRPDYESETLWNALADRLRSDGLWAEFLKLTAKWMERSPESMSYNSPTAQHLAALVMNDQFATADALVRQWLRDAQREGALTQTARARAEAAINFAFGNSYLWYSHKLDSRWQDPLAEFTRFFARQAEHSGLASRVMSQSEFQETDVADRLRGEFLNQLRKEFATLPPSVLNNFVNWTLSGRIELVEPWNGQRQLDAVDLPDDWWTPIADGVAARWAAATEVAERRTLGATLISIYGSRLTERLLPFLREQARTSPPDHRGADLATLLDHLQSAPWTSAIETEALSVLIESFPQSEADDRLVLQASALCRLVDALLASRETAEAAKARAAGGLEKLTRKDQAARESERRINARQELAARLLALAVKQDGALGQWLTIEADWLRAQDQRDLAAVRESCWAILGEVPRMAMDESTRDAGRQIFSSERATSSHRTRKLESILHKRALTTVMFLAGRRTATAQEIDRLMKYFAAGDEQSAAAAATKPGQARPTEWRQLRVDLLVALDRVDELEKNLRRWIAEDAPTAPWRLILARLQAERGAIPEAIALLEACARDDLLQASDYRLLADLYLATGRRDAYETTRLTAFLEIPENALMSVANQLSMRWSDQPEMTELDDETLLSFRALMERTSSPENYLDHLRDVYASTRDFRLLQIVPAAVLGRSPQQIYNFLSQLSSQLLTEVRNEATADEIVEAMRTLRQGERSITDLRALDLLEALIERRMSELQDEPEVHQAACVAALKRAFDRPWTSDEAVLMSGFLVQLGHLPELLDAEQIRELRALREQVPGDSRAFLQITHDLAEVLGQSEARLDEAIQELEPVLRATSARLEGQWPYEDLEFLSLFAALNQRAGRHAAAEAMLIETLRHLKNESLRDVLRWRLADLYLDAFDKDSAISLGTGRAELLEPLSRWSLEQLKNASDDAERHQRVARLVRLIELAHRYQFPQARSLLQDLAHVQMPVILKQQSGRYRDTVIQPLGVLREIGGAKAVLRYVVERMEQYAERLEITWENAWQTLGAELAQSRREVGASDLDDRILALATRELRQELLRGDSRGRMLYYKGQEFWSENADGFARVAEEFRAERRGSGRAAVVVATYFMNGLDRPDRALEIMFEANTAGLLHETAQHQLVRWLFQTQRAAESIPILESLIARRPDSLPYRTDLMTAYFTAKRPNQLQELLTATHAHFHQQDRWTVDVAATLGLACVNVKLPEKAIGYLTEAIALYQRDNPTAGRNNETLSDYYNALARAYSARGETRAAVDAILAAIVCWSDQHVERENQLQTLREILDAARDLNELVTSLDADAARTGQDLPIVRKILGMQFHSQQKYEQAIAQLKLAVELTPQDPEIHEALIACYDSVENPAAGTRQLLALIDLQPHHLPWYQQLQERLAEDEAESERAATSMIEASPLEAENHAAFAELREAQDRWSEAVEHWKQVAELRRLEPTGLLRLAAAQIHLQQWDAARDSIKTLRKTTWPARFENLPAEVLQLESQLPE